MNWDGAKKVGTGGPWLAKSKAEVGCPEIRGGTTTGERRLRAKKKQEKRRSEKKGDRESSSLGK